MGVVPIRHVVLDVDHREFTGTETLDGEAGGVDAVAFPDAADRSLRDELDLHRVVRGQAEVVDELVIGAGKGLFRRYPGGGGWQLVGQVQHVLRQDSDCFDVPPDHPVSTAEIDADDRVVSEGAGAVDDWLRGCSWGDGIDQVAGAEYFLTDRGVKDDPLRTLEGGDAVAGGGL